MSSDQAMCHFTASGIAAIVNFPLWRASAIAQAGYKVEGSNFIIRYAKAVMQPPYKGVAATMMGMTWARAAIFYGSDVGKKYMLDHNINLALSQTIPPLLIGTFVQVVNMPLVRATITIQDPTCELRNVREALIHIYKTRGVSGLWHGVSAGVLKTVPKYIAAVGVKDYMEYNLPHVDPSDKSAVMTRLAIKSVSAGVFGAALTNPLDVIRNEMFKTELSLVGTFKHVMKQEGWAFMYRGISSNMTAVAIPIAITIFMTDVLISRNTMFK